MTILTFVVLLSDPPHVRKVIQGYTAVGGLWPLSEGSSGPFARSGLFAVAGPSGPCSGLFAVAGPSGPCSGLFAVAGPSGPCSGLFAVAGPSGPRSGILWSTLA
jgi:hypothetical protein